MYNDNAFIERIMREVGAAFGTRFEFECYDIGHLYTLAHFADRKLVDAAVPDPGGVRHPRRHRRRRAQPRAHGHHGGQPVRRRLPVLGLRRRAPPAPVLHPAALLGGNVRVGLEDSLFIGKGELAQSNAEQVRRIRVILEALGLPFATNLAARAEVGN